VNAKDCEQMVADLVKWGRMRAGYPFDVRSANGASIEVEWSKFGALRAIQKPCIERILTGRNLLIFC
jgi:hypothetical protein